MHAHDLKLICLLFNICKGKSLKRVFFWLCQKSVFLALPHCGVVKVWNYTAIAHFLKLQGHTLDQTQKTEVGH